MKSHFGDSWYSTIQPEKWIMWRRHINIQLFDNDIVASEAISVLQDVDKKQWPMGTGFFSRVRDQVLLQRKTKEQVVRIDKGLEKLTFKM